MIHFKERKSEPTKRFGRGDQNSHKHIKWRDWQQQLTAKKSLTIAAKLSTLDDFESHG